MPAIRENNALTEKAENMLNNVHERSSTESKSDTATPKRGVSRQRATEHHDHPTTQCRRKKVPHECPPHTYKYRVLVLQRPLFVLHCSCIHAFRALHVANIF